MGMGLQKQLRVSIVNGKEKGEMVELRPGTCKIIGRALDNPNETFYQEKDLVLDALEAEIHKINSFLASFWNAKEPKPAAYKKGSKTLHNPFQRTQDLILQDIKVSRVHAMIFNSNGACGLVDLMSKNGTFLNGQRIDMTALPVGSVIKLGSTELKVEKK
jgi:hypothetical protein